MIDITIFVMLILMFFIIYLIIYGLSYLKINIDINNGKTISLWEGIHVNNSQFLDKNIKKNKLLNILYIFNKLCDDNEVYYIISYGTLLGSVRHWGMVPWDDDIDIIVRSVDRPKIYKILEQMHNGYGFRVENLDKLSRVYSTDGNESYFMDIFFAENINGKVARTYTEEYNKKLNKYNEFYLENNAENEWWWNGFNFNANLIEERKKFLFDGIMVWGPSKPNEILKVWYGDNYLTECKTHYLKNHNEHVNPETISCGKLPIPQL